MNNKFIDIPLDEGTKVLSTKEVKVGTIDAVFQNWKWEGVKADSIVFCDDDVATYSDEELIELVKKSVFYAGSGELTIKRNTHDFTFINLNFVIV